MTSIVGNQRYVAAYGREVGRELFSRTICGESILLWRTEAGEVTAMSDHCVHRRFPLSQAPGHLVGDTVVCGYHGFTYGSDGFCVAVPHPHARARLTASGTGSGAAQRSFRYRKLDHDT